MTQKIHLISYGNHFFEKSKNRIFEEAKKSNWFNTINIYGPENVSEEYINEFNDIWQKPRGAGYWIWKFYIIKQQLINISNNDILIYIDAGCTINLHGKTRFDEYINM